MTLEIDRYENKAMILEDEEKEMDFSKRKMMKYRGLIYVKMENERYLWFE
jgi:hypothetical protein